MNEHDSFWKITKDSLEYAMNSLSMNSVKIKNELLDLYFKISAFEEVEEVLKKIKLDKNSFIFHAGTQILKGNIFLKDI